MENGQIIGDTPDERLVLAEAEAIGAEPWSQDSNHIQRNRYHRYPIDIWDAPPSYRNNLVARLEDTTIEDQQAVTLRGLARLAMSQRKPRMVAIDLLYQLAEKTIGS